MQEYIFYENSDLNRKQSFQHDQELNAFSFDINTEKSPQLHQTIISGEPMEIQNPQAYQSIDWKKYQDEQSDQKMMVAQSKQKNQKQKIQVKSQEEEPHTNELELDQIFYEEKKEYESDNSQDLQNEEEENVENEKPRKRRRKALITDSQKVVKMKKELQTLMKDAKISEDQKKKVGYKLKNRISAQQSRDRQKAYIVEIELKNKKLKSENDSLQYENQKLRKENSKLKEQSQTQFSKQPNPTKSVGSSVRSINKATLISFTFLTFIACICTFSVVNYHYRQNFLMKQNFISQENFRLLEEQKWIQGQLRGMNDIKEYFQNVDSQSEDIKNQQYGQSFLGESNITKESNYLTIFCTKAEVYLGKTTYSQPIEFIQFFLPNNLFEKQSGGVMDMAVKVLSAKIYQDIKDIVYIPKIKKQNDEIKQRE